MILHDFIPRLVLTSTFRGRPVMGQKVQLPTGYTGQFLYSVVISNVPFTTMLIHNLF